MSTYVAVPHEVLRAAGRHAGRRLAVLDLWERADAVRYGWVAWTERELSDAWSMDRRGVVALLDELEARGWLEVERAAPRSKAPSRLRVRHATRGFGDEAASCDSRGFGDEASSHDAKPNISELAPETHQTMHQTMHHNNSGAKPVSVVRAPDDAPDDAPHLHQRARALLSSDQTPDPDSERDTPAPAEPARSVAPGVELAVEDDRPALAEVVQLPTPARPAVEEEPTEADAVPAWARGHRGHRSIDVLAMVARVLTAIRQRSVDPQRCATDARSVLSLWRSLDYPPADEFVADAEVLARWARESTDPLAENDLRGIRADGARWGADRSGSVATLCRHERWSDRLDAARRWASGAGPPGAYVRGDHPGARVEPTRLKLTPEQRRNPLGDL